MPYSEYTVKDRKAVAQIKYQIRRFLKQAAECGTDPERLATIKSLGDAFYYAAAGSDDFEDDGTPIVHPE